MAECLALADLGARINLMPFFVWKRLSLPNLTPTFMTLELADRSISRSVGVADDVYVKVGSFHSPTDFVVVDSDADPRVPLNLKRSFLKIERALIDVFEAFLNDDPSLLLRNQRNYPPEVRKELNICEAKSNKSSVDEPPVVELKILPPHLEYAFLEGDDKLPVIIAKDLSVEEKTALITVLKSHKRAIAWKLSDIKGINPEFCTHKILMEEDFEPTVQHQRRVNPKIYDVIKQEVIKLLDAGLIYPISDSPWVSPVHCVPKKGGTKRTVPVETLASPALVSCDGLGGCDWSDQSKEGPTNFALMTYSSISSNSETSKAKASTDKPKVERKNFGPTLIKDWISNSKDEAESKSKIEKETVKPSFAKIKFVKYKEQVKSPRKTIVNQGDLQQDLQDKGVINSRCLRNMTRNMSYLTNYEEIDGGYVAFRGNPKGRKITGRVPRKNNMYSVDLKNIVLKGDLTCLFAKSTSDESKLWHRRLGHLNFKTINKLVNGNLVRGSPSKLFESNQDCVDVKRENNTKPLEDNVNNTNNVNAGSINGVNVVAVNTNNELPFDPEMPSLEDISTFNFLSNHEDDDEEADMNNLDTTIQVTPTPTTRIHKDHPIEQVIGDLHSTTQTRNLSKNLEEHGFLPLFIKEQTIKTLKTSYVLIFYHKKNPKR
nr:DNA-directed DNA polymerase [Tanacetum cinerariifolium]